MILIGPLPLYSPSKQAFTQEYVFFSLLGIKRPTKFHFESNFGKRPINLCDIYPGKLRKLILEFFARIFNCVPYLASQSGVIEKVDEYIQVYFSFYFNCILFCNQLISTLVWLNFQLSVCRPLRGERDSERVQERVTFYPKSYFRPFFAACLILLCFESCSKPGSVKMGSN